MKPINPFVENTGSDRLRSPLVAFLAVLLICAAGWIMSMTGWIGALAFLALPFIFVYMYLVFRNPVLGLYSALILGFILIGAGRYLGSLPIGLGMDGILVMTYVALFFNRFRERIDWRPARKDITILAAVWFGYTLLQLLNPEAKSPEAWFSGRGIGMYMMLIVPLTLLLVDTNKKLDVIFYIWGVMSLLATIKGIIQVQMGPDAWEKAWLDEGNAKTHILFGNLRAFSFLSDAGQFGANQGYTAVVALIVSMAQKGWHKKTFFLIVSAAALYGMFLSGTRGALSVPLAGLTLFFILRKNILVLFAGFIVMLTVFVFFKYTTIGQDNIQIRRMRTAFDPNDASLQVRLDNQKKLKTYLSTRPFGGGIGHAGVKAQRYLPDEFLSNVPTDSGYVLIWAEGGIVGLSLYLFILIYIITRASYLVLFRIRDPRVKMKITALASGMFGILAANYGNAVLNQMPTSILIFTSMALMLNVKAFDTPEQEILKNDVKARKINQLLK